MKKLLWLVAIVAVVGLVMVAGRSLASPERQACSKLHDLCGGDANAQSLKDCEDGMEQARKLAGDVAYKRSLTCIDESQSCAAASGCMVGGVGMGAVGEFFKGFGSALTK
jgi:hypothetical protein